MRTPYYRTMSYSFVIDHSCVPKYLSHPVLGGRINNKDLFPKLISVGVGAGTLCAISTLTRCGLCEIGTFFLFGVNPVEVNHVHKCIRTLCTGAFIISKVEVDLIVYMTHRL